MHEGGEDVGRNNCPHVDQNHLFFPVIITHWLIQNFAEPINLCLGPNKRNCFPTFSLQTLHPSTATPSPPSQSDASLPFHFLSRNNSHFHLDNLSKSLTNLEFQFNKRSSRLPFYPSRIPPHFSIQRHSPSRRSFHPPPFPFLPSSPIPPSSYQKRSQTCMGCVRFFRVGTR